MLKHAQEFVAVLLFCCAKHEVDILAIILKKKQACFCSFRCLIFFTNSRPLVKKSEQTLVLQNWMQNVTKN